MPFYLSEYRGTGTRIDPFTPVGFDQPGWSAIDIRPDASRLDGGGLSACLLWVPNAFNDPKAQWLGDDKLEGLTNQQKNFLRNKLNVDLTATTTIRDVIATIMMNPPTNGWKGLQPVINQFEIWLNGLFWTFPLIQGGAWSSDDYNRANAALTTPWDWVASASMDYTIDGNRVRKLNSGDYLSYYAGAASGSDQGAEIEVATLGDADLGAMVRIAGSHGTTVGQNGYIMDQGALGKWVNGSFSIIQGSTSTLSGGVTSPSVGNKVGISAIGSTIRGFIDRWAVQPYVTDTSVTGGQPGIFIFSSFASAGVEIDNWRGGDIGAISAYTRPSQFTLVETQEIDTTFISSSYVDDYTRGFTQTIPAGSLVIFCGQSAEGPTATAVLDTAGNTWNLVDQETTSGQGDRSFIAYSFTSFDLTPLDFVYVNWSSGVNREVVYVTLAYQMPTGTPSFDGYSYGMDAVFPESSPASPGTVTALRANTLAVNINFWNVDSSATTWTNSSGFTTVIQDGNAVARAIFIEHAIVGAGSVTPSATLSPARFWRSYVMLFSVPGSADTPAGDAGPTLIRVIGNRQVF